MLGKKVMLHIPKMDAQCENVPIAAYLCETNGERDGLYASFEQKFM